MHQLHALSEVGLFKLFGGEENFRGVEAEFGVVAGGGGPFTLAASLEFGAEADEWFNPDLLGDRDDVIDLGQLLDDDDDFLANFTA